MTFTSLNSKSNFWKPRPKHLVMQSHLMLAGINQLVFLNQWGEPEIKFGLHQLGSLCNLGSLFLIVDPDDEADHSVWIYKKMDRILFFTKKRLISHFKWSDFKERCKKPKEEIDSSSTKKTPTFMVMTLAFA